MTATLNYGPDLDTRPARFRPPSGACDVHAHVFGPLSRFPYSDARAFTPPTEATFAQYERMHEVLGIERGVLTQPSVYGIDNGALLDALDRAPRLRGIVALMPEALTEPVVADLDARGVTGVRINCVARVGPKFEEIEAVAERVAEAGWHLEIVPPDIDTMAALCDRLERLPCSSLFDQMARPVPSRGVHDPAFQRVLAMLRGGKLWVKLSHPYHFSETGPPYADVLPFAQALVSANPERCLWGTDWPHPAIHYPVPNDGTLLDLLVEWVPDEATRRRILVDNPAELHGFA